MGFTKTKKNKNKTNRLKNITLELCRSWWLILFTICCYVFYERGMNKHSSDFQKLQQQYLDLQKEKMLALTQHGRLTLQVNSQTDPKWVELTLINRLGLVKEGQTKVLFTSKAELLETEQK